MPTLPTGGHGQTPKQRFLAAEREQESGGDYLVINPNSGALGAWQVMPDNLPGWLTAAGLPQMSDYDYLHDPAAQNQLAWVILGGAFDRYGAAGAAAWWYSGKPDPKQTDGDPPVYEYVADVLKLMGENLPPVNTTTLPSSPYAYTLPPPNEGDWSSHIRAAAAAHYKTAGVLQGYADRIDRLR
jgi:hypothetical protein